MQLNPLGLILVMLGAGMLYMGIFGSYRTILADLQVPGFSDTSSTKGK